jgi:hypothetical protein
MRTRSPAGASDAPHRARTQGVGEATPSCLLALSGRRATTAAKLRQVCAKNCPGHYRPQWGSVATVAVDIASTQMSASVHTWLPTDVCTRTSRSRRLHCDGKTRGHTVAGHTGGSVLVTVCRSVGIVRSASFPVVINLDDSSACGRQHEASAPSRPPLRAPSRGHTAAARGSTATVCHSVQPRRARSVQQKSRWSASAHRDQMAVRPRCAALYGIIRPALLAVVIKLDDSRAARGQQLPPVHLAGRH